MPPETPPTEIPKGWRVQETDFGIVASPNQGPMASFRLTGRRFPLIDFYLHHHPIAALLRGVERVRKQGRKLKVLDAGGGRFSRAARDLLMHPLLGQYLELINVDPFAETVSEDALTTEGIKPENLRIFRGTLQQAQDHFRGQIDLVYSYELLPNTKEAMELLNITASLLAAEGEALLMCQNNHDYGGDLVWFDVWDPRTIYMSPGVHFIWRTLFTENCRCP